MALVKGFRGIRFDTEKAGNIEELVCPPYDIISDEQRVEYIERNEYNIIRLELPKGENPYQNAKSILDEWLEKDVTAQVRKAYFDVQLNKTMTYGERFIVQRQRAEHLSNLNLVDILE